MLPIAVKSLLDDPNVGMLFISFPINAAVTVRNFNKGMQGSPKPKVMVALGDTWTLFPKSWRRRRKARPSSRVRPIACCARLRITRYGRLLARSRAGSKREPFERLPKLGKGQPEWLSKKVFAAAGIRVPDGKLAHTADEAVAAASRIGYPVALKAQAAALTHKTEMGGVMLNLIDLMALRAAWAMMLENMKSRCAARGARRHPR